MDAGRLSEESRAPAQVDDVVVLTQVLPGDPENSWRRTSPASASQPNGRRQQQLFKTPTVVKLLRCLWVKVEVFEELWRPVLLVAFAVATLPAQVAPGVLQLQETHPLQEERRKVSVQKSSRSQVVTPPRCLHQPDLVISDVEDSISVGGHQTPPLPLLLRHHACRRGDEDVTSVKPGNRLEEEGEKGVK